jgi:hypothetical protein
MDPELSRSKAAKIIDKIKVLELCLNGSGTVLFRFILEFPIVASKH